MENGFEQKVADFWRDVQAECDPIQKELGGLIYYVFQTKYRFNPDLMIVGMNPRGGFTGEKFLVNKCAKQSMYVDWYLQNPSQKPYPFFKLLCDIFGCQDNSLIKPILENAVGINNIYFNTQTDEKLKTLPAYKKIVPVCNKYTRLLVDEIIRPKVIIALGIDPFYCLKNKKEVEIIVVNDKLTIKKSFRNDIPIYYIPNPSVFNINKYYKPTNILDLRKILENIF